MGEDDFDYNYHTSEERKGKGKIENTLRDIGIFKERLLNGITGDPTFHIYPYGAAKLNTPVKVMQHNTKPSDFHY